LSILLATHRPNFGIGGTGQSLTEGLLAALTFPQTACNGTWLIATGWEPEPQLDSEVNCAGQPMCHAVAMALSPAAEQGSHGTLRLVEDSGIGTAARGRRWQEDAGGLCHALEAASSHSISSSFAWQLPFGGTIVLDVRATAAQLPLAA
jgi:hypothetical protein